MISTILRHLLLHSPPDAADLQHVFAEEDGLQDEDDGLHVLGGFVDGGVALDDEHFVDVLHSVSHFDADAASDLVHFDDDLDDDGLYLQQ